MHPATKVHRQEASIHCSATFLMEFQMRFFSVQEYQLANDLEKPV